MSSDPNPTSSTEEIAPKIEVSARAERAGDSTPTKPGTEAAKASSGTQDHSKHPPSERAENADIAVTGSPDQDQR